MTTLTLSLAQMDVAHGDVEANFAAAAALVEEAARRGSDLVLLPELWDCGFALNRAAALASRPGEGLFARVSALARQHAIFIAGSMLEAGDGRVYNCATVFSPEGELLARYRKAHLISLMGEDRWLAPGDALVSVALPWGRTGLAICYDLRFPEVFRRLTLDGARLILLPASWPYPRWMHWRALTRARAIENQVFFAACNRVGQDAQYQFFGASALIDPWGARLVEAGEVPALLTAEADLARVDEERARLPALAERRADLYG